MSYTASYKSMTRICGYGQRLYSHLVSCTHFLITQDLNPGRGERLLSSPKRPDQLWRPSNIFCVLPASKANGAVKLTTHTYLVPRFSKVNLHEVHGDIFTVSRFIQRKRLSQVLSNSKSCNFQCHNHLVNHEPTV